MTYAPEIYDWRESCAPLSAVFRAGGQSIFSGLTLGGASVENPEPGGRAELVMSFAPFATPEANLDASWTVSRIMNGNVMRVRLYDTVQLVPWEDLDVASEGQPWANDQPWSNDENWRASPFALIAGAHLKGASTFTVDMTIPGAVLRIGHVIGFQAGAYDFAHVVMDITYDDLEATVTIQPPLRRALANDDQMLFRPSMLVVCRNAREVMGNFQSGRHMAFNAANFVEAMV